MTFRSTSQNLLIDVQGGNNEAYPGKAPIQRVITVRNRGDKEAIADLWLKANDDRSKVLLRWCTLTVSNGFDSTDDEEEHEPEQGFSGVRKIKVPPRGSRDIRLRIDIPTQAEAGFYSYDILAESPDYPGERSQRTQQLRVIATTQEVGLRDEPTWMIQPPSSSDDPYRLQVGQQIDLNITVHNRTKVVDRYHLRCPELDSRWFKISYPESDPNAPGLMTQTDGLMLNPGESGQIILSIHPPDFTPAGYYSTTVRLTSRERDNLVLLDIIYLEVVIDDRLIPSLDRTSLKIPSQNDSFHLTLNNAGNILRDVELVVAEEDQVFTYQLNPPFVTLKPGQRQILSITPKAKKWWRRSWQGEERLIDFQVQFLNAPGAETLYIPDLPDPLDGQILWQSRSPWIKRILLLLLVLLLLAGTGWLVYWLVREVVVEPSLHPKIIEFDTWRKSYPSGQPIRLNWLITNPKQGATGIITVFRDGNKINPPQRYDFKALLKHPNCEPTDHPSNPVLGFIRQRYGYSASIEAITCTGIPLGPVTPPQTPALTSSNSEFLTNNTVFLPGKYEVKLEVFQEIIQTEQSSTSSESRASSKSQENGFSFPLPWQKSDPKPQTSDSKNIKKIQKASDSKSTKEIQILPPPPPAPAEIRLFSSKAAIYRQNAGNPANIPATAVKYPLSPIKLNLAISNPKTLKSLQLSYLVATLEGPVESGQVVYPVREGIPAGLGGFCRLQEQQLICEEVPAPIKSEKAGKYIFTLMGVVNQGVSVRQIYVDKVAVEMRPPFPEINSFQVNGRDVLQNPLIVLPPMNPTRGGVEMTLNWQVPNPDRMKVELLPIPGLIDATRLNSLKLPIGPSPGNTTVTLQVTNAVGETINRSVTIQTTAYTPPPPIPTPADTPAPPPSRESPAPTSPFSPDGLPLYELPPRSN